MVEDRQPTVFVPNWFTVDLKTGMLTLHFCQVFITLHLHQYSHYTHSRTRMIVSLPGCPPERLAWLLEQKVDYGGLLLQV